MTERVAPATGTTPLPRTVLIAWVAMAVGATFVLFIAGSAAVAASPAMRVIMQVLTFAAAAAGLVLAARQPPLLATPVVLPLVAFVVVAGVSALGSERPATSVEAFALTVIAAPVYLAVRAVAWDPRLQGRLHWLAIVAALLLTVPYAIEIGLSWLAWWYVVGPSLPPLRPGGATVTLASTNIVAAYLYLLGPLALAYLGARRRSVTLIGSGALVLLLLLAVTGSRGAWLGFGVGAIVASAMLYAPHRHHIRGRYVVAGVVGVLALTPLLLSRLTLDDAGRLELWSAALGIGRGHPIFGAGIGTWQQLRALWPIVDPSTAAINTPHDIVVSLFAELGAAGLLVALLLIFAIIKLVRKSLRGADPHRRLEVALVAGSLTALGIHSLVDPLFHLAGVMLIVFYLVARLDPPGAAPPDPRSSRAPRLGLGLATFALVLAGTSLVRVDVAMLIADDGGRLLVSERWAEAADRFDEAIDLDDRGVYRLGAAVAKTRSDRAVDAERDLRRLSELEPFTFADAQRARLALAAGETQVAAELARQVMAAGPYDPTATVNAAYVLHRVGDEAAAAAGLIDIVVTMPQLASPDSDGAAIFGTATWADVIEASISRAVANDPLTAAQIALAAGDPTRALELAGDAGASAEQRVFLQYVAMRSGETASLDAVRDLIRMRPTPRSLGWFSEIATALGAGDDQRLGVVMEAVLYGGTPGGRWRLIESDVRQAGAVKLLSYPEGVSSRHGPTPAYALPFITIQAVAP